MSESNKSQMLSEAEIIEAINADSLVSVSLGAGQPQKNVKMSTLASVAAELIGVSDNSLFKQYAWLSGNLNDAKHGLTVIQCWDNVSAFTNMPISDKNANAILFTLRNSATHVAPATAIQFFLHGYKSGICYFRCLSNNSWSAWKIIS